MLFYKTMKMGLGKGELMTKIGMASIHKTSFILTMSSN